MIGMPCVGKGTNCYLISKKFPNIKHISAGELLRNEFKEGTKERKILDEGGLISIETINALMEKAILEANFEVILDGYPRTIGQAEFLKHFAIKHKQKIKAIFILICDDEELIKRTHLRRICSNCQRTFAEDVNCCGQKTIHRADDTLEVFYKRKEHFLRDLEEIRTILEGPFYFIDGRKTTSQVFDKISHIVESTMGCN
jgi:adenylate kinase